MFERAHLPVAALRFDEDVGPFEFRMIVEPDLLGKLRLLIFDAADDRALRAFLTVQCADDAGGETAPVELKIAAGEIFARERDDVDHAPIRILAVER